MAMYVCMLCAHTQTHTYKHMEGDNNMYMHEAPSANLITPAWTHVSPAYLLSESSFTHACFTLFFIHSPTNLRYIYAII